MSTPIRQHGSLMIAAIAILVTLGLLSASASRLFITQTSNQTDFFISQSTLLLAESGVEKAKYALSQDPAYSGETATNFANGNFSTTVLTTNFNGTALSTGQRRIISTGLQTTSGGTISRTVETIITLPSPEATGFAAGKNGTLQQWDGSQWNDLPTPRRFETDIEDAYCSSSTDCWFVGKDGEIVHWDGSNLDTISNSSKDLNAVTCIPNNPAQCFAVGKKGTIQTWNGVTWTRSTSPNRRQLNGIHCVNSECYAVGDNGTILHFDGTNWINESVGGGTDLNAVYCLTTTECWVVGDNNNRSFTMYQRDNSGWTDRSQYDRNNNKDLNGIACQPQTLECWAVGDKGTILNLNGSPPWSLTNNPANGKIRDIWCSGTNNECWAVGSIGGGRRGRGRGRGSSSAPLHWVGGNWVTTTTASSNRNKLTSIAFISGGSGSNSVSNVAWKEHIE